MHSKKHFSFYKDIPSSEKAPVKSSLSSCNTDRGSWQYTSRMGLPIKSITIRRQIQECENLN